MRVARQVVVLVAIAAAVAVSPGVVQAQAPAPAAVRAGDRILDPATFAAITYEGTVNISSFQQDGLLTAGGYQYTAWYRADRRVTIARRLLPGGAWRSIELDSFLQVNDSHNTISMAATPSDGRLHIALGTHGTAIRYIRSVPELTTRPDSVAWSSKSFKPLRASLPGAPDAVGTWTYPMFETVRGTLMLTWRDGSTDNGRNVVARYNHDAEGTWTYLGQFTASSGSFTSPFGTSTSRYAYLHGFGANPVSGDIEISWSWREQTRAWCHPSGLGNHDIGYATSADAGLTWRNNAGQQIGATGGEQISIEDPHVVVPVAINRGLINQEAQTFDGEGRVHVMTSQFNDADLAKLGGCHTATYPQRAQYAKPYHHWRSPDGVWHSLELPFYNNSAGRNKLLFDRYDTAYLVLPDARIAAATAATQWTDWRIVFSAPDVDNIAELIVDRQRLSRDGVLSVAYQETSTNEAPSAFRVADFVLNEPTRPPQPKSTQPEAAPVPYEGSAAGDPGDSAVATASSSQPGFPPELAIDGNAATFWVSSGTAEGQGPQPSRPEILTIEYRNAMTIREVRVTPRSATFGPRAFAIEARVDGAWRRLGDFTQGNTAETFVVAPTTADAIRLVITAAYDGTRPADRARNVQIAEVAVTSSDTSQNGDVSGTVPATLALSLGGPAAFPSFVPGVQRDYSAETTATVTSTAGDATLAVADPSATAPGHLANGAFSLAQPLAARVRGAAFGSVGSAAGPLALLSYGAPVSNDLVTLEFRQTIGERDALRTGHYSKTLTFTLATTSP